MGQYAAQDTFTRCLDEALADIPRKLKCVDDTLFCDYIAEALWHASGSLGICGEKGSHFVQIHFAKCNFTSSRYQTGQPAPVHLQDHKGNHR